METALLVLCALFVNAAIAGPRRFYQALGVSTVSHIPARALRDIERRLNRDHRSSTERYVRGWVVALVVVGLAAGLGWFLKGRLGFVEVLLLALLLPVRPTFDIVHQVASQLRKNNLPDAKNLLVGTPWRHHALLDQYGVGRAAIELMAIQFNEKIVAPVFWYVLFGLPGLLAVATVTYLRESLPRTAEDAPHFSTPSYMLHRFFHFLPSRISAFFWLVASAIIGGQKARTVLLSQLPSARPQALTLTTAAGVLGLSLGGPSSVYGAGLWYGAGRARVTSKDVQRAVYIYALLCLELVVVVGVLAL